MMDMLKELLTCPQHGLLNWLPLASGLLWWWRSR